MATKSKTLCDRCGAEIMHEYPRYKIKSKYRRLRFATLLGLGDYDYIETDTDLCPTCNKALNVWLKQGRSGEND